MFMGFNNLSVNKIHKLCFNNKLMFKHSLCVLFTLNLNKYFSYHKSTRYSCLDAVQLTLITYRCHTRREQHL